MILKLCFGVLPLLVLTGCLAERKGGVFAEYTSPQGAYKIRLSRKTGAGAWWMLGSGVHIVRAEVHRGSTVAIAPREIHYADSMDDSFNQDYCDAAWELENVLRFQSCYPVAGAPHRTADMIVLRNAAAQTMAFVAISTATDLVILLDVPSKREIRVPITGRIDQNWFRVRGLWADGRDLPTASPNFFDLPSRGSEFRVTVESRGVDVVRRDARGRPTP